ncbi:MAG: hypothetical protein Q8M50_07915, partial [Hydrogenophaga sp.]|nr:hypothetical protein [Hydrogenophaga sp.]
MIHEILLGLLAAGLISTQAHASNDAAHGPGTGSGSALSVRSAEGHAVAAVTPTPSAAVGKSSRRAHFAQAKASTEARHVAHWVVDSGDNRNKPFVIVDKREAKVFVFDAQGKLSGASSALLGLAIGDHS